MVTITLKVTEISLVNNIVYISLPTILNSWNEIQNKIQLVFQNQKTYLTKEEGSNESLIQSTTNKSKVLLIEEY